MKRQSFCEGWLFEREGKKTAISLPHDAMQEQGRKRDAPSGSGGAFFLGGNYRYEKRFWVSEEWRNKEVILEFEGVYPQADVYLNGKRAGGCQYGYSLFRIPLKNLKYDEYNDLCVEVDHTKLPDSRWYSGSGIYRPVWLLTGEKEHIEPNGIRIKTLSYHPAKILVEVLHTKKECKKEDICVEIYYKGKKVAESEGQRSEIVIPEAVLWDDENPNLYQCAAVLRQDGKIIDTEETKFGIRLIEWSDQGFRVNGRSVLLKGGCIHHDNGILGARTYEAAEWRKIKRLKEQTHARST